MASLFPGGYQQLEVSRTLKVDAAHEVLALIPDAYDPIERVVKFAMLSWDTGTLQWVKFTPTAGGGGGGGPVTVADGADVAQGSTADAAWVSGAGTVISLLKKIASPSGGGLTDTQLRASAVPVSLASTTVTGSVAVTGPLTDTQLRAVAVPVSGTFFQATQPISGTVSVGNFPATQPVSLATNTPDVTDRAARLLGHVTVDNASLAVTAAALPLPAGASTEATLALIKAKTDNLDVLLSTRTKPADTQPVSAAALPLPAGAATEATLTTLLKPASTLAAVTTVAAVTAITNALPAGTNRIGSIRPVDSADADLTAAKNAQTARFLGVQRSIDAGRNTRVFQLDVYTAAPLAEALANVVQWYGNAAVVATTAPAVVPAGKTLRLCSWKMMYQSIAAASLAIVRVRCNVAGVAVLASPLVFSFEAGSAAAVAGVVNTETGDFPEGLEIPAGAGLGFSIAGYNATGVLTLAGGVRFFVYGYEY